MTNVAEELASPNSELTKVHVVKRVEDWKRRVSGLYQLISNWISSAVEMEQHDSVFMDEDLMKRYGVPSTTLPILTLTRQGNWLGKLVPQGLWIIGANGRVDLFTSTTQAIIVDRSENFAEPNWLIAPAEKRRETKPFDEAAFRRALGI